MAQLILDRPRVRRLFDDAASSRVILVTGMAGAGKTTAVRQWVELAPMPSTWLTLDSRDNDPGRLWPRLAEALPGGGHAADDAGWEAIAARLAEAEAEAGADAESAAESILVLDDLHFLVDPAVLRELGEVLGRMPPRLRVLLVSRSRPSLPLARLRASGELIEIDATELAFTGEEIAQLLSPPSALVETIEKATGGWPVAVGLTRELLSADSVAQVDWAVPRPEIADYLAEEVLATLPDDVQDFVRDSSVLDELTAESADAVLDRTDSAGILDFLAARGIFLARGPRVGWVVHAVVRDVLRDRLERMDAARARRLNRRAAAFFSGRDLPLAITHALAADDADTAAGLIENNLLELQSVLYASQLRWLDALPERSITSRPALAAHAALVAAYERRFSQAERWLRARDDSSLDTVDDLGAATMRAVLVGDLVRLRTVAGLLRERVDRDSTLWSLAHGALAGALHCTGDSEAALRVIVEMWRTADDYPAPLLPVQGTARAVAARLLLALDRPEQASTAMEELREWVANAEREFGYADLGAVAWIEAIFALSRGDASSAAWTEPPAPEAALGLPFFEVWLLIDFAAVRSAAGDEAAARRALYRVQTRLSRFLNPGLLEDWFREIGSRYGIVPLPRLPEPSRSPLLDGLSGRETAVLDLLDSDLSLREIAAQLSLSQNTLKSHLRGIYRKLDVNSRLSAVRVARESTEAVRPSVSAGPTL